MSTPIAPPTTAAHGSRYEVQLEVTDSQQRLFYNSRAPSRESLDTRQHFCGSEWFHQVVITTGSQTAYAIIHFAESADDQRGGSHPGFPKSPDNSDSIDPRKHSVDGHHSIFGRLCSG